MLSVICSQLPLPPAVSSSSSAKHRTLGFSSLQRHSARLRPSASEKEESQVEVDREKALEALQKLDQQIQSLTQKEFVPKNRPTSSYPGLDTNSNVRMSMRREEMPEISASFLAYSAGFLIILTIVNNIIFNVYVKPLGDGLDRKASTSERVVLTDPSD